MKKNQFVFSAMKSIFESPFFAMSAHLETNSILKYLATPIPLLSVILLLLPHQIEFYCVSILAIYDYLVNYFQAIT